MTRRILWALALGVVGITSAQEIDPRGWSKGTPAATAAQVLARPAPAPGKAPDRLMRHLQPEGDTLVLYFSPTCPHCRRVGAEWTRLAAAAPDIKLVGVVGPSVTAEALAEFRTTYGTTFPFVVDEDHSIAQGLGIQSTPSAVLYRREKKKLQVLDVWFPYRPGTETLVRMAAVQDPFSIFQPDVYQGNQSCMNCHPEETDSWLLSHHSVAWRTLEDMGKHTDPACNTCHVTGAGQPTGWKQGELSTEHLVSVGCESCHGPSGPHDGRPTEPSTTCASCHDDKHSLQFSYAKGLPLIDHYKATGMGQEEWLQARRAIAEGTAPRALLSFDQGSYAGSEACQGCHTSIYTDWLDSPHGQAMATLRKSRDPKRAHKDVSCVSCHSTPQQVGPRPDTLEGYFADQGVGCESCHGPGQAHIDAGGAPGTIEGLGESCPVCVLEAVCTSCHTSDWDPAWSLDAKLPQVRHTEQR